jgi:hypothetical protein
MIDDRLVAFINEPVMIMLAAADALAQPVVARGVGALYDPQEGLGVMVSRRQYPDFADALAPGGRVAATFCRPTDYTTFQVKGEIHRVAAATPAEAERAGRYVDAVYAALGALGVGQPLIDQWVFPGDIVSFRFTPSALFAQTPGPNAGAPLRGIE